MLVLPSFGFNRYLWRVVSCCVWTFSCGFSDASPGALLPFIERYYGISYSVVSIVWMANAAGFITVAALSHKIQQWLGMRRSLTLGCGLSVMMYAMVLSGAHFAVVAVGFYFGGAGLAIGLAQTNIYLARLERSATYLAYLHGSYGVGATVAPLIGTVLVSNGVKWSLFYLFLLGQMLIHAVNIWLAFEGIEEEQRREELFKQRQRQAQRHRAASDDHGLQNLPLDAEEPGSDGTTLSSASSSKAVMRLSLTNRATWLMAFFIMFYQGAEVSMAGWVVTYLLDYRHALSSNFGYVASGFWGGLTIGRLFLTGVMYRHFGARKSVIILGVLSIAVVAVIWVIPSAIAAGCLVALAGILIGPNYTLLISISTRILPRKIQVVSLTIITAFGSSGGAIFPFLVGLISQGSGTYVVLPVFVALYSSMLILWICLPNVEKVSKADARWWLRIW